MNSLKKFEPTLFLIPLGAGGLAITLWAFLMFTLNHGSVLITHSQIEDIAQNSIQLVLYTSVEVIATIMAIIHIITLIILLIQFLNWRKTKEYINYIKNPQVNSSIMTIFLTIDMFFNVVFAIGNHFFFTKYGIFQTVMAPALITWTLLYFITMMFSIRILKTMFTNNFDIDKMHFGFLIHPFALSMLAVTGFGIAAFSESFIISSIAFFLALAPWSVSILLLIVKIVTMFQHHFKNNLPDRNFLPSTLIVMPIVMLIFMSLFRMGHYLHNQLHIEVNPSYYIFVTMIPFVFLLWYGIFSLTLIKDYFKNFKEFNVTQWAFICPIAATSVIGYFANKFWLGIYTPLSFTILIFSLVGVVLYFNLLIKQIKFWN